MTELLASPSFAVFDATRPLAEIRREALSKGVKYAVLRQVVEDVVPDPRADLVEESALGPGSGEVAEVRGQVKEAAVLDRGGVELDLVVRDERAFTLGQEPAPPGRGPIVREGEGQRRMNGDPLAARKGRGTVGR